MEYGDDTVDYMYKYFKTVVQSIFDSTNIEELLDVATQFLLEKSEEFVGEGSGWIFDKVTYLNVKMDTFIPISGGTYKTLPKRIAKKKAVINMKNDDERCFAWSIARAICPTREHQERIDNELRIKEDELNWEGIEFPVNVVKGPTIFEKNNPGYKICIVGYEENQRERGGFFPLRPVKNEGDDFVIDLLLYKGHYCLIKSLSRLLGREYSKKRKKVRICRNCFNHFYDSFEEHQLVCFSNEGSVAVMPRPGEVCRFKNHHRKFKVPFDNLRGF